MLCDRCKKENAKLLFLSAFNEENICISCKEKEEKHTLYKDALRAARKALEEGNFDFKGIGLPKDLKP